MADGPAYREVADRLREALRDPFREPGVPLDSERILAERFGVSTSTVRKAIGLLRAEGLVDVVQGSGVFPRTWKPILRDATKRLSAQQWGEGKAIWEADLGDRLVTPASVTAGYTTVPAYVAELFGTEDVLVRRRLYVVDKRPVQYAVSYYPAEIVRGTQIERRDTGPGGVYNRLAELGYAPAAFTETLRARTPSPDEQQKLRIQANHPVAEIVRYARTVEGRLVEVNEMVLDGEAYIMQWSFTS